MLVGRVRFLLIFSPFLCRTPSFNDFIVEIGERGYRSILRVYRNEKGQRKKQGNQRVRWRDIEYMY